MITIIERGIWVTTLPSTAPTPRLVCRTAASCKAVPFVVPATSATAIYRVADRRVCGTRYVLLLLCCCTHHDKPHVDHHHALEVPEHQRGGFRLRLGTVARLRPFSPPPVAERPVCRCRHTSGRRSEVLVAPGSGVEC